MGMFDYYDAEPALHCPWCESPLTGWQGKDGPCRLVVWQQGAPTPTRHEVDDEHRLARHELDQLRLPGVFGLYTECRCTKWVIATGFCQNETWREVALGEFQAR